ncbi:unnamed protein product [Symbiodinium natans]|uniref:Uncharacterized protein n=1 Tax=Symbiodinium natans TaxID=878477 RepID=A0A812P475_9DINO|nr:unnamed protein product [Symbiodinium natans]
MLRRSRTTGKLTSNCSKRSFCSRSRPRGKRNSSGHRLRRPKRYWRADGISTCVHRRFPPSRTFRSPSPSFTSLPG